MRPAPSTRSTAWLALFAAGNSAVVYILGHLGGNAAGLDSEFYRWGLEALRVMSLVFFAAAVWLLWLSRRED